MNIIYYSHCLEKLLRREHIKAHREKSVHSYDNHNTVVIKQKHISSPYNHDNDKCIEISFLNTHILYTSIQ